MRIATLSPFVPYEGIPHAGGQFLLHWARALSLRGAEVTVIAPRQKDVHVERGSTSLEPFDVVEVTLAGSWSMRRWGTWATGPLLTPGWGVRSAIARSDSVATVMSKADIVEVHWSQFLPVAQVGHAQRKPVFAIAHDVISDSMVRQITSSHRPVDRIIAALRWPAYRMSEPRLLNRCAGVLSFSERDATLLVNQGVRTPVKTIAPWIEPVDHPQGPSNEKMVLMVGAFNRCENSDGARWFLRYCWPQLSAELPGATLVFAGANPPSELRGPRVFATGWVEDLDPWYRRATVAIAPLLSGAGLKFKVAQAMRHELPIVATPVAADGYREIGGSVAFASITSDTQAFAQAVRICLENRDHAIAAGRRGAVWARQAFDWDRSVGEVSDWYRRHCARSTTVIKGTQQREIDGGNS